jgi:hypothetical protein
VTSTTADHALALDHDGQLRTVPRAAGADE